MKDKIKLVFLNTHPIQYYSPLYKKINESDFFDLEVWYCTRHGLEGEKDREFNTNVKWDTPLLEGYNYRFFKNISWKPGMYTGFWGIINPGIFTALRKLPKKSIIVINAWHPFSTIFTLVSSKLFGHNTCLRTEPPLVHEFQKSKVKLLIRKIFLKNFLFKFADNFLYIGSQNRKFYEYYGVASNQLIFSPYSVNNNYFSTKALELLPQRSELRRQYNIPPDNRVILFSGKLIPKKRPMDLLQAYQRISERYRCTLVFMGEGKLRAEMEAFIKESGISNVLITGFINQSKVSDFYTIADVFVMCSDVGETWGLSTNEAMNFGLPVVISDFTGNFEDLVKENGYVTKTGNVEDLTEKLEKLLSEPEEEWRRKGENSKKIISEFSYDIVLSNLKLIK